MRNVIRLVLSAAALAVAAALLVAGMSSAEEDGNPVVIGTYRTLQSQVLDEERTLLISLPKGYEETSDRYPVLFILYGGQVRGYFAEAVHIVDRLNEASLVPQLIIVGVKNVDRYRDNLPVNRRGEEGGAEKFLKFFTDELIPFLAEEYRTEDFRILLGPQAGAAFALYTLMEKPGLFRVNIVTNPFWSRSSVDYLMARSEDFFSQEGPLSSFFFVTSNTSDDNEATMRIFDRWATIVRDGNKTGFTVMLNPLGEEDADDWIPSPGLKSGLKAYFKEYKFPGDMPLSGLEDLTQYYRDLSEEYGYEVEIPQFTLIRRGHGLEGEGKLDEAQVMFEYARDRYPHGDTSYLSLAGVHQKKGEYDTAIDYYEQFLARRHEPFIEQRLASLKRYMNESAAHAVEMAIAESGAEAGTERFEEIRAGGGTELYFDEAEFNALGYALIARGIIDAAIEVFKMNVEMHPESANAYDSLGEAYLMNEDVEQAVLNYKRSMELNPDNSNAREVLERLGEAGD